MNMKKLISILFISAGISTLQGYPYQFRRLIQQEGGKIVKVVDLISEAHVDLTHPVPDVAQLKPFLQQNLLPDERDKFDAASRRLLATLRHLAKETTEKKKLLIEASHLEKLTPAQAEQKRKEHLQEKFIRYIRYQLLREFSPEQGQRIVAENIDSIRRSPNVSPFLDCLYFNKCGDGNKATIGELAAPLFEELLAKPRSIAELCLAEAPVCRPVYQKLFKIWKESKKEITTFYERHFEQTLEKNPTMLAFDFVRKKRKETNFELNKDSIFSQALMDFESLVKILSSEEKHVIVYAGGSHCSSIAYYLEKDFDFKLFIQVGYAAPITGGPVNYIFPLSEHVWAFLKESPESSLKRFPIKNLLHESSLRKLFFALRKSLKETAIGLRLNEGAATYVDIANVQEKSTGNTPYHYAIQNDLTKTLLKLNQLNANKYIKNKEGKTPLDYLPPPPEPVEK